MFLFHDEAKEEMRKNEPQIYLSFSVKNITSIIDGLEQIGVCMCVCVTV